MALYIASKLKVKTLVIVHKSFLLNQWIERIEQFLPDAKVGKIQGPTIDVEDKDIVIGMLQSLSIKEYSNEVFKDLPKPKNRQGGISVLRNNSSIFEARLGTYDVRTSGLGYLFATQDARASETYWRLTEVMGSLKT